MSAEMLSKWLETPCTKGEAIVIALVVAWVLCLYVGWAVESNAKNYADKLNRSKD